MEDVDYIAGEIESMLISIDALIEDLAESPLEYFVSAARQNERMGLGALWRGVADTAECRRAILARYRTGEGIWIASVVATSWDIAEQSGESKTLASKRCTSKLEAEQVAREMLVGHAKNFSAENSIQARVVCDLEWKAARRGRQD